MSSPASASTGPSPLSEAPAPHPAETAAPLADFPRRGPANRRPTKLLIFLGLAIVVGYMLDATISAGLRRIRTSKYGSLNRVFEGRVNADIVINGSSRALVHYDPRIIGEHTGKSAYNLGLNGVQIDVQLAMLKAYLAANRPPQVVIQNLEAFSFEVTKPGEIYDPATYIPYLAQPVFYQELRKIDPNVWKWRHIPLYGYAVEDMRFTWVWAFLAHLGYSGPENYFDGFNPRHLSWSEDFQRFSAKAGNGVSYRIDPKGVAALTEIVDLCRKSGIRLILVFSPEYIEMQALERNRSEIFSEFQRIAAAGNIPFWDYSDSLLCRDHQNFYNSQHLNAKGAEIFSNDLARKMEKLIREQPTPPR